MTMVAYPCALSLSSRSKRTLPDEQGTTRPTQLGKIRKTVFKRLKFWRAVVSFSSFREGRDVTLPARSQVNGCTSAVNCMTGYGTPLATNRDRRSDGRT